MSFFGLFKAKAREPQPRVGDFRISRIEKAGGEVWFVIERFGDGWGNFRRGAEVKWASSIHACYGPRDTWHPTLDLAKAALERWQKARRDSVITSETVVWPAENPPAANEVRGRGA